MGAVLIDNWNVTNAKLYDEKNMNVGPNAAYMELLSALILWDEVYYLDEGLYTFGWLGSEMGQMIKPLLTPLSIDDEKKILLERSSNLQYRKNYGGYKKIVAQRAIYYHEISKMCGLNYFPVKDRADFLKNYIDNRDLWSRQDILNFEEKEILERVYKFNTSELSFVPFPILHSLILKNSNSAKDYASVALQIKESKEVVNFRKYMDQVDEQLNLGNDNELRYILKLIPEIVDDIQRMDRRLTLTTEFKLKISPTIMSMATFALLLGFYTDNDLLSMGLMCSALRQALEGCNFEVSKTWTKLHYSKKIQMSFLRTLAKNYVDLK